MRIDGLQVIVAGGGIAGLAAATALAQAGARVRLHERAEAIAEVGAGIQITPNGTAVLAALGCSDAAARRSSRAQGVRLYDYRGGPALLALDLDRARHGNAHPWLFFHRADLIALLAEAAEAAGVEIRLAAPLDLGPGALPEADLVIGAEGLRSGLRGRLDSVQEPFFTGQVAWRALVPLDPFETAPPVARLWMGPRRHLVAYPLRSGRVMNVVAAQERHSWVAEGWSHRDDPETLRETFADFAPQVRALLARAEAVHVWGLFRHPVARRWHDGARAVILGDAAHPTLPFLAQGANMGLEDAWALRRALERAATLPEALAAYQAARAPRTARIVAAAGQNARLYHLSHPLGRGLAQFGMRLGGALAPGAIQGRYDWIHGHDVTRD